MHVFGLREEAGEQADPTQLRPQSQTLHHRVLSHRKRNRSSKMLQVRNHVLNQNPLTNKRIKTDRDDESRMENENVSDADEQLVTGRTQSTVNDSEALPRQHASAVGHTCHPRQPHFRLIQTSRRAFASAKNT